MVQLSQIIISRDDYNSEQEFWDKVGQGLRFLMETNNVATLFYDKDKQQAIIKFNILNPDGPSPYWLYTQEAEQLAKIRQEIQLQYYQSLVQAYENGELEDDNSELSLEFETKTTNKA